MKRSYCNPLDLGYRYQHMMENGKRIAYREAADPTLIRKLPDGEIRRYNRRQNIIFRECRQSEVMQRVLAFYRGNFQEVME